MSQIHLGQLVDSLEQLNCIVGRPWVPAVLLPRILGGDDKAAKMLQWLNREGAPEPYRLDAAGNAQGNVPAKGVQPLPISISEAIWFYQRQAALIEDKILKVIQESLGIFDLDANDEYDRKITAVVADLAKAVLFSETFEDKFKEMNVLVLILARDFPGDSCGRDIRLMKTMLLAIQVVISIYPELFTEQMSHALFDCLGRGRFKRQVKHILTPYYLAADLEAQAERRPSMAQSLGVALTILARTDPDNPAPKKTIPVFEGTKVQEILRSQDSFLARKLTEYLDGLPYAVGMYDRADPPVVAARHPSSSPFSSVF